MLERYVINKTPFWKTLVDGKLDKLTDIYVQILTSLRHVAAVIENTFLKNLTKLCTVHCSLLPQTRGIWR